MACPDCDDTGWRPITDGGVRRVVRCTCWQGNRTSALLREARVPPRYGRCDLDNFLLYDNERLVTAVTRARRFADSFPAVSKGLCLIGPPGIGKTHIAVAVLRSVVAHKGARGLFYDVRDLLRDIRSTYNPVVRAAEMDILRPVMEADVLVLDDLGAEKPSEWVEETMNLIVNTRYNERRPTIFTTNYEDLPDETELDSLKVRVGFRMHSRLHEMCEFLEYEGGDYRMMPANGGPDDLATLWKRQRGRRTLPARATGPARAQIRSAPTARSAEPRELTWPGGKAGR
ncbi:MAG TPA: ATP-binding protein [Vicinamibacterales bacterium]|jgi:DNA replication protein DnaC|nr:ATP-binding protein [Vicinamibacterales bacterium]